MCCRARDHLVVEHQDVDHLGIQWQARSAHAFGGQLRQPMPMVADLDGNLRRTSALRLRTAS